MNNFYTIMAIVGMLLTGATILKVKNLLDIYKIYKNDKSIENKIDLSKGIIRLGIYIIAFAMYIYYLFIVLTV